MENLLFSSMFWGGMLILAGILIVINGVFHTQIPTFRVIAAVVFVVIGIMILNGSFKWSGKVEQNTIIFSSGSMPFSSGTNNEYNIIFGSGVVQLENLKLDKGNINVKVNTIFGSGTVEISHDIPVKIMANAAFGGVRLPNERFVSFGHDTYQSENLKKDENILFIDANAVFGSLRIISK